MKRVWAILIMVTVAIAVIILGSSCYQMERNQEYNFGHNNAWHESWQKGNQTSYLAVYDIRDQNSGIRGDVFDSIASFKKGPSDDQYLSEEIGKTEDYGVGAKEAITKGGFLHNPTMEEIYAFLLSDQTNKQKYDEKAYNCVNFTAIFKSNAEAKGLKAGTVFMTYKDPQGNETKHQMICFRTEDAGLVLVEPQTDAVIPAALKEQYFFPRVIMALYCQW